MPITRPNIVNDAAARQKYAKGVKLLKNEFTGPKTTELGIPGPAVPVSTYDLFIVWHHVAMMTLTPPTQMARNSAHGGPVFLPWHRFLLLQMEMNLQRVLGDNNFGLPYWDWAADGQLTTAKQKTAAFWKPDAMGGQGSPIANGPFTQDRFRVKIESNSNNQLVQTDHGLRRAFGANGATGLPRRADTAAAVSQAKYDQDPWDSTTDGFRNFVEGWNPGLGMHNRVHVWVGGDMLLSTSPNDPVFYMNHCNADRIWEAWLTKNGRTYVPDQAAPPSLKGHRIDDQIKAFISGTTTPRQMLDVKSIYVYDSLAV